MIERAILLVVLAIFCVVWGSEASRSKFNQWWQVLNVAWFIGVCAYVVVVFVEAPR